MELIPNLFRSVERSEVKDTRMADVRKNNNQIPVG